MGQNRACNERELTETKMAFSIDAVLKRLFDKFEPDLSISRELTKAEFSCYATVESFLVETAENYSVQIEEDQEIPETQASSDDADYLDSDDARTEERSSIEQTMSSKRIEAIWDTFKRLGRGACLKKHQISHSQLKSVKRHFEKGDAENLKTRAIRSHVAEKFTEV